MSQLLQERLREREFYKYFEPLDFTIPVADADSAITHGPVSAVDVALKAFAQLGAIRLDARRSMISLLDRDTQYIVAEATRTLSLQIDTQHADGDSLWLGCTAFPRVGGICQYTVNLPPSLQPINSTEFSATPTSVIVNDLSLDERFRNHPAVIGAPFLRFYAGVPIRTSGGLHIGSYCILDDKPRHGLSEPALQLMKDLSVSIFTHLENMRVKQEHRRSEKMVRGVGAFIEGKASMQEWWDGRSTRYESADKQSYDDSASHSPVELKSPVQRDLVNFDQHIQSTLRTNSEKPVTYPQALRSQSTVPTIKTTFGRASNIIREAIEVEGVLFLDATVGSFAGYQPDLARRHDLDSAPLTSSSEGEVFKDPFYTENTSKSHEANKCHLLGFSTVDNSNTDPDSSRSDSLRIPESVLRSLLRKYPRGRAFILGEDEASSGSESESKLKSIRSEVSLATLKKKKSADAHDQRTKTVKKSDPLKAMMKIFVNAKSLIFYPLWDPRKERWFAGAIAWSNKPTRLLTEAVELNYLASFSNSVMAEVARLDVVRADRTKTDFISSISHELRSPLHGILGSVEVLQETSMDQMQDEMVRIVESCGRTLLDTFNHLLEYAKINSFTRNIATDTGSRQFRRKSAIATGNTMIIDGAMSLCDDIDLSIITEEVLQTMCATSEHLRSSTSQVLATSGDRHQKNRQGRIKVFQKVNVILDIDATSSWEFQAPSGAWRRVLMNLVGNSLKYTSKGFIHIRLQAKEAGRESEELMRYKVSLIITDSGKGMDREYLRDRIFTPFAQEDSLMPGTGLGLSIVRQIVESLGGSIDVNSQKSKGTEVKVNFDFVRPAILEDLIESKEDQDRIASVRTQAKDLKVKLQGFGEKVNFTATGKNDPDITDVSMSLWKSSIERLCTTWFGMRLTKAGGPEEVPDLIIWHGGEADVTRIESENRIPTIIIHQDVNSAYQHMYSKEFLVRGNVTSCISQPVGPLKLAKALESFFKAGNVSANGEARLSFGSEPPASGKPILETQHREHNLTNIVLQTRTVPADREKSSTGSTSGHEITTSTTAYVARADTMAQKAELSGKGEGPLTLTNPPPVVLLVDDNDVNLRLLIMAMKKINAPYATATNGLEAFNAYKANCGTIRHVFMDISMPVMDGMQSSREIRQFERKSGSRATKIIALTGLASASAKEEAQSSGIDLFLTKPVLFRELKSIVTSSQEI